MHRVELELEGRKGYEECTTMDRPTATTMLLVVGIK